MSDQKLSTDVESDQREVLYEDSAAMASNDPTSGLEEEGGTLYVGMKPPNKKEWWGTRGHELIINEQALNRSLMVLRFGVFADAINATILQPNYPFMVIKDAHPDSFDSTAPFDFSAAQYFLPMSSLLGTALASTVIGYLSDKQGRKPWILACMFMGVAGSIAKYLLRKSYWGFCAANFVNGLFGASLSVAMAYVSDVKPTRAEKDAEIGNMVAFNMIGMTGGGICAILMGTSGLFTPLFIGASMNLLAGSLASFYLIEPKAMLHFLTSDDPIQKELEELEDARAPKEMNWKLVANVLAGALADNFGSSGMLPICLSPLAFTEFYQSFIDKKATPVMTQEAYKWLSVSVAMCVIPGAALSQGVFNKIGPAGGCVMGNALTGVATIALLLIATIEPATTATYAVFFTVLYVAFPMTVISQLSTGPMLDALSPTDKRGFTQGLNVAAMSFASSMSPFILGLLSDSIGTETTIWICVGISFFAALVNLPLVFAKSLKRAPPLAPDFARALKGEDTELVERALRGEWIPLEALERINQERMDTGRHFLVQPIRSYEEDKKDLVLLRQQALADFEYQRNNTATWLRELDTLEKRQEVLEKVNNSRLPEEERLENKEKLGEWFTDYLEGSGYRLDDAPLLWKQLFMKAFPPLIRGDESEVTPENFETTIVSYSKMLSKYLAEKDRPGFNQAFSRRFGQGAAAFGGGARYSALSSGPGAANASLKYRGSTTSC
ncbi:major facilitator superfamily protein [Seminavis robusta]|uniref:Major facilitator superfamily protein n=1 Tax=Seminavis robusta TaxID=568900 RepID=A0A9N8E330_9STRA|nr:major facilitator superfamily protein [Seminavis robusta]|eukprot:Sro454_g146280.1 major facilitator superfamily protein (726) ;mRNA; r:5652-8214